MQQLCNDALKKDNTSWYYFSWDQNTTIASITDIIMLPATIQALLNRDHHLRLLIVMILESWPVARRIVIVPILLKSWPARRRIVIGQFCWSSDLQQEENCDHNDFVVIQSCNKKNFDCDCPFIIQSHLH
jgi:hypothetical protein